MTTEWISTDNWNILYEYTNSFGQKFQVMGKEGGTTGDVKTVMIYNPLDQLPSPPGEEVKNK